MKRVCIVIPYFGKWPSWIDLYFETCKYNPTIDWLFFTDCNVPNNEVDNITFISCDLEDISLLASSKLGFEADIRAVYKLCDFRPAYGKIFEDYLKGYDFWGYGDIDLVYGNLRKFLADNILETYEIISAVNSFLSGHFCLYRNIDKINNLFVRIPGYKKILQNKLNQRMDEKQMTDLIKQLHREEYVRPLFKKIMKSDRFPSEENRKTWKVYWNKGKLLDSMTGKELAYFHFLVSKGMIKRQEVGNGFYLSGKAYTPTSSRPLWYTILSKISRVPIRIKTYVKKWKKSVK